MSGSRTDGNGGGTEPKFSDFVPEILDGLEDTFSRCPFDTFDAPSVFGYWMAELFETTEEGSFYFTDGGRELGIDFYVQSEHSYYIYQCKTVDLDTLMSAAKCPKFDADDVNDLLEGIDYLRNDSSKFSATKKQIKELRTKYQRDLRELPEETHLYATVAVLGELTPGGQDRFDSERTSLAASGVTLRLISWHDIYEQVHALEPMPLKNMKMQLRVDDKDKDILYQRDWVYALVYASDLIDAFDKYGVRLFDLNVRHEIRTSKVNKAIVETLQGDRGRKDFHHYNNGLLIVCNDYKLPSRGDQQKPAVIQIHEPQIINGCQTVSSLARAYHDVDMVPSEQEDLRKTVKVQVKLLQHARQELVDEVVITTNNQNPMNPRNLKSNTREQRDLQKAFRELSPAKWFYIRKDGEFEALSQRGQEVQWFRKKDYEIDVSSGRPRYRKLDNSDIAKAWFSWIGSSGKALVGGFDYFDTDSVYEQVFKKRPNDLFWEQFSEPTFDKVTDELFELVSPTAHQLILARSVASYIKERNPSPYVNRRDSIVRLVKSKQLSGNRETGETDATQAQIAQALAQDQTFIRTGYFYNMENVLTELSSFLLTQRYSALTPTTSRNLLQQPDIELWSRRGFCPAPGDDAIMRQPSAILWRLYEFLKWSIQQNYFTEFKFQIEAAARPKMYFARKESIKEMKRVLLESNELVREGVFPWKSQSGQSLIESLPPLG
ncbi:MAG: hypothetical protein EG823_00995 [Actinobacteria bacterium]|nr:hypothetical protein [Actinomycetota bacterium]